MDGGHGAARTWTAKGRVEAMRHAQDAKAVRAKELLAQAAARHATSERADRVLAELPSGGLTKPLTDGLRYRRTINADDVLLVGDGLALLDTLRRTAHDGRDRIVLAWPCRPDNGFVAAALHLLEGRARGHHAHQAIGLWPWRNGITWTSRSILVEHSGLLRCAMTAVQERSDGAAWTKGQFSTEDYDLTHLGLRDLSKSRPSRGNGISVHRPSLLELTSVFTPLPGSGGPYTIDSDQVLSRVRRHTRMKDIRGSCSRHVRTLGDPMRSPLAVFGLPAGADVLLKRCLAFERFQTRRLDAVVVDLTRTSLNDIGHAWDKPFGKLLLALEALGDARPGLVVLAEDAFVVRKVEGVMREAMQVARSRRPSPETRGLLLRHPGLLDTKRRPIEPLGAIEFRADLKDGRLLALRDEVLRCARSLEENEDALAALALRAGLSFVRSMANFPIGLADARSIVEVMHATDDEADRAVRRKLFVGDALQPLTEYVRTSANGQALEGFRRKFMGTVESWQEATPVSAKLAAMMAKDKAAAGNVLLVLPDRHVANVYNLSDAAQACTWQVAEPKTMLDVARSRGSERWVVVRPNGSILRTILMAEPGPKLVDVVGDAAGSALLEMELRPLSALDAFAPVRGRAAALLKAIGHSVASLETDHEEVRSRTATVQEEIDFTQGGGRYTGEKVRLVTERGYTLLYRPTSEVLRYTPDDLRAFEKSDAKHVQAGDAVLVLSKPLMESLRRELAQAPKTIDTLRQYHIAVGTARESLPSGTLRDKGRHVLRLIQAKQPGFADEELPNVCRWLDVDGSTLDDPAAQPQAPMTRQRHLWFMDALGVMSVLATAWWDHGIRLTRSYRLSEGLLFNQRATGFVVDPESFTARSGGRDLSQLQQAIMDNVDVVKRTEMVDAGGRA